MMECRELVMRGGKMAEVKRPSGENDIAIVGWRIKLATCEFADGREFIVIANDMTLHSGTFGVDEAVFFKKALQIARDKKIPVVFISANCGTRVGLADELRKTFQAAWKDPKDPDKGIKYLYLTPKDYGMIANKKILRTAMVEENGEILYKITDIIGIKDGLGVENLHYSSMIASEMAQAFDEIITISLVSSKTSGIGANIVSLSQRVVQIKDSAIVLTDFSAINRNLGYEAYDSDQQLGGTETMARNGITHKVDGEFQVELIIKNL